MINRSIQYKSKSVLLCLYKTLVRPHLEYCTQMVSGMKVLPYKERLRQLGLRTIEERRNRADLIEMFKMLKGKSSPIFDSLFERLAAG